MDLLLTKIGSVPRISLMWRSGHQGEREKRPEGGV